MRPLYIWIIFGSCLIAMTITMVWVNGVIRDLDHAQQEAQKQAVVEENTRLALWRLDSYLAPMIAQENAAPYFYYSSFYPLERAYTQMFNEAYAGELLVPSPLITSPSENILLHFQIHPNGKITSPQLPSMNMRNVAKENHTTDKKIDIAYGLLSKLQNQIDVDKLYKMIPKKIPEPKTVVVSKSSKVKISQTNSKRRKGGARRPQLQQQRKMPRRILQTNSIDDLEQQQQKSESEFLVRKQYQEQTYKNSRWNRLPKTNGVGEGVMKAIWLNDLLLFVRPVIIDNECYYQGCWLNWERLKKNLLGNVEDLLPGCDLKPFERKEGDKPLQRTLAVLPIQLIPGDVDVEIQDSISPTKISLYVAWGCMLLAAVAITVLLFGVISISERRASFVSSVTHELRTPLTTFRMYAEMLNEGMVSEKKQKKYFSTMLREAQRLTHLVENVLEYARLERKRTRRDLQPMEVRELMSHMQDRLEQRAVQGQMELVIDVPEEVQTDLAYTDATIVEQIIFNLVDNACKYASQGSQRKIEIHGEKTNNYIVMKVRDYGPGLQKTQRKKLFGAFSKSAEEAAHSAPGVGLGLALSHRLAKHLHGKLVLNRSVKDGAAFILYIPKHKIAK